MFAEQPSVKLCCQLCCSVFKDPVITTCGVRPPSPPCLPLPDLCTIERPNGLAAPFTWSLGLGHKPGLAAQQVPSAVGMGQGRLWLCPKSSCCLHSTRSVEDAP